MKIIDHGSAKPDDPIYQSGPVIGGVRFHNPSVDQKPKDDGSSILDAIAAITPEQAKENDRYWAKKVDEAIAKGQHPMQPYADYTEEIAMKVLEERAKADQVNTEDE